MIWVFPRLVISVVIIDSFSRLVISVVIIDSFSRLVNSVVKIDSFFSNDDLGVSETGELCGNN